MAGIKEKLQEMISIGEDPKKIQAVADQYKLANPNWSVTASTDDDPVAKDKSQADVAVTVEDMASNGEDDSTDSQGDSLTETIMGASYQVSEEGIASGKKNREAARNFFSTKKTKLEQALDNIAIEKPLTKKDINNVDTDLQLARSPKIKELEAKLKEAPSMSQEAADISKEIESIKSATTESRVNPRNKSYQKSINIVNQHGDKVSEITNRVIDNGGDEHEVKKQVDFYEKNNPEQTRINTANYEVETINRALDNISTASTSDTYSSYSDTEEESTELSNLVEQQIIEDLSIKDMGRAAENNYTLSEKENIIRSAKQEVIGVEYEKANDIYDSAVVLDFIKKREDLDARIKSTSKYDDEGLLLPFETEEEANEYNDLINQYNALDSEQEKVNDLVLSAKNRLETTFTELGFNAIDGTISNNFEMTDDYQEWRDKHVKERGFWGGTYDAVGTLVQEGVNLAADATVGTGIWMAGLMDETVNEESRYYNGHDAIQDSYKNFANFNWAGTSDYGADILDKDGNYTINARSTTKTIANMLPFTMGVILSARSGNLKPAKSLWNTVGPKFLTSPKGRSTIRMVDASYRMTVNDNFHEGKDLGLDDGQSYAYSSMKSFGTGLSQMIMPDANFLGSTAGKTILKGFVSNLKNSATKKAIGGATKQFVINMGKELGEEELELAFGDIAKYSVGLQHSPDILDLRTQKETIAATLMLSGSLGSIGTANDIKNAKKQVYQQYKDKGQDIIDVLDDNLKVADAKFKNARTQKSKDNHQATINQINDAKNYGQSIINAVNSAPENVSDDQIDLLIQKQELVKQKQGKDKAISIGIDNQIKEIDEKISNSVIKQGEEAQTKKNIATVKETIKKSGLDGNVSEMTSEEISDVKEEGFDSKSAASQFGFIKQKTDGSFEIVLNKDKPMVGVESHEFMHAVLFKTVGNNEEIQDNLGDALVDHVVNNLDGDKSILGKRLSAYGEYNKDGEFIRDDNFGEETITIMSESIVNGSLKFDENFFTKVGDVIRRFSQNYLGKEITFDNGRDVYNFVKDYSKNIKDGKINKAILRVAKEGAKGKLVSGEVEAKAGTQMSKTSPEKLVRIIKNPKKTTKEIRAAENDLTEQFDLLALKALKYDTRKGDISRDAVRDEARKYLPGIIKRFNPTTSKFSTFVNGNMAPKQAVIYEKVKGLTYGDTISIDTKEAREIADTSTETTQKGPDTRRKKTNVLKIGKVERKADAIRKIVKVKEGDTFKEVSDNNAGKVAQEIFDVPASKITDPKKNLTYAKKIVKGIPEASEAGNIQSFYTDPQTAEKLIKILPEENVTSVDADINEIGENIDVDREVLGRGLGLNNRMLNYFYEKTSKRSKGKTSQPFIWKLKSEFKNPTLESVKQFQENLGITPRGELNNYNRNIGQLLKGVAKFQAQQTALSTAQRILTEQKAPKKQIASVTAAQSKVAFSRAAAQINILSVFELETKGIDNLLKHYGIDGTYALKTEKEIDSYVATIKKDLLPLMPKEFWFGKSGGTVFTGSSKVLGTSEASKKLYKEYYEPAMKALASDAGVKFGADIKGVNDYSISSYKTIFKDTKTIKANIKNGKIDKWNKKVALIHEAMWFRMSDAISGDKNKAKVIGNYMKMTGSDSKHWHKRGAQFVGYSVKPKLRYEYEHAMPATAAYLYLMDAALSKSDFKASYKVVKDNYKLMALDKAMDKKLTAVGLQRSMPKGWDLLENNWWDRYFNSLVASQDGGINPASIKTINGKTFGEEFNVNSEGNPTIVKAGIQHSKNLSNAISLSRLNDNPTKGITVLDFDDTLATSKSLIRFTKPDGTKGTLNAEQYASTYQELTELGYKWDFSEFNKVVKGKVAPLFNKAMKLQGKFGPENMFVLTARPAQAAPAIFEFLQANGLNIPIENITGLANSTAESKANWIAEKVADGYNDFYFADDALQNVKAVKNMLGQFDVKSKVQQAKVQFSKSISINFNNIIEQTTGIESKKVFSDAQAKIRGHKSKYKSIIPPSAQDFIGLLYNFLGKGKKGEQDMAFFKKALIDPFARGIDEVNSSRQAAADDYVNLQKEFGDVKKIINKKVKGLEFTNDQAARVYLWNKAGFEVPGLSKRDLKALVEHVGVSPSLQAYADGIGLISKKENGYSKPGDYWLAENITSDLLSDGAIGDARADFLAEWQQNANQVFSNENLNKIEAIYGSKFREALEDILYRMKTGKNRPAGGGRLVNTYMNWVNNSVGAIMFLNMRSATLQTISATNYINWTDNNPLKAAAAFGNQKQFWTDFSMIWNSPYLKQRRSGNQRGINEAELSAAVAGAENKAKAALNYLLKKGFTPTQLADSFAISIGGAPFYRNRVKKYVKEGMSQEQAESRAFLEFRETTEVSQQSARPDMISQQQASPLGRLILSFQNTPMQYARVMNKATRDLTNGRGDYKTHISKIVYYGVVQSIIFGALQSAIYASLGDDDEFDKKKERILNQMVDSWLTGIGYGGKAVGTVKNTIMEYLEQREKGFNSDHTYTILTLLSFSPPIGSKLRKIYSSIQTEEFNRGVFEKRGLSLDNPAWSGIGNVIEGATNAPLGRISNIMLQLDNAMDSSHEWWQRVALVLGQNTWDLGIKDPDIEAIKTEVKEEKKIATKERAKVKKEEKKVEKAKENEAVIEENKKKSKKDGVCSAVSKGGDRCGNIVVGDKSFCTVHEKATQNSTGKKSQCKKIKKGGKRCGMQTSAKGGYCYYHD